jgi:hypothetical protein
MPTATEQPRAASARDLASYLVALRPILAGATEARRVWVKRIGVVMADLRQGNTPRASDAAGQTGRDALTTFRDCQLRVERLRPPEGCLGCQRALVRWLEKLIAAGEALVATGRTGQLRGVFEAQELLADSRVHAQRFNAEYARLIADLRQRVAAAERRPRARGRIAADRSTV